MPLVPLLLGCGPAPVTVLDSGADSSEEAPPASESPESTDGAPESGNESETETETGNEAESGGEFETETDTGERDCVPWAAADSFDQICFSPPELVDPAPFYYLDRIHTGTPYFIYVSGPDDHRVYAAVEPGADYLSLPIAGVTIWRNVSGLAATNTSVLVTRSPHAILHVDASLPDPVLSQLPLEFEPRAVTWVERYDRFDLVRVFAVADAQGVVHLLELDGDELVEIGARQLPEPVDALDFYESGYDGQRDELVGYARASATAYRLSDPLVDDGPIHTWALAAAPTMWKVSKLSHHGPEHFMVFANHPSRADRFSEFGQAGPFWTYAMDYPVDASTGGVVPWGFASGFVLSRDAAKLAEFGEGNGETVEYSSPSHWVDAPADVADIMMIGASFVCASPSEGLSVWRAM